MSYKEIKTLPEPQTPELWSQMPQPLQINPLTILLSSHLRAS